MSIALTRFQQTLRPYQQEALDHAIDWVETCDGLPVSEPAAHRRVLYSCPTGTGKGSLELAALQRLRSEGRDAWILTPSLEVIRGFLERCGATPDDLECGSEALAALGESIWVTTPTRIRNRIAQGERGVPEVIIYDEGHHAVESGDVSGDLFSWAPLSTWLGYTATPFRGTPRGTQALDAAWPEQVEILSIPEAVEGGWWALPTFEVVPLLDDDRVQILAGDFSATSSGRALTKRCDALAEWFAERQAQRPLPTAIVVPSRESGRDLIESLDAQGYDSILIQAETPARKRARAYAQAARNEVVLITVAVLTEGVDLPWLRRLVCARPTTSPVAFLQRLGRITRPCRCAVCALNTELAPDPAVPHPLHRPEYVTCCRNLERHAYLLGGMVPRSVVAKAQTDFGGISKRAGHRSLGYEALSKFRRIPVPCEGGLQGVMYLIYSVDKQTGVREEWGTILDPTSERSIVARRLVQPVPDGRETRDRGCYGRWAAAEIPPILTGFATSQNHLPVSDKQKTWWERAARRHGLDPTPARLTRRQFAALPILSDLKERL